MITPAAMAVNTMVIEVPPMLNAAPPLRTWVSMSTVPIRWM